MRAYTAAVLLASALLSACGTGADAEIAASVAVALVEEMRIGQADGGPAAFGRVTALEAAPDGSIVVADGMANEIRVFGRDGRHRRTFGGKGAGPGEFLMISGLSWGPNQQLWIMDPLGLRLSAFDTTGRFLGSQSREFSLAVTIPWAGRLDERGRIYDLTAAPASGSSTPEKRIVRYLAGEDGRLVGQDTFPIPDFPTPFTERLTADGITLRSTVPFAPSLRWRIAPDGSIWIGSTLHGRLARVTMDGDTVAELRLTRPSVSVTGAERDSAAEAEGMPAREIPDRKPAVRAFFVDDAGRVWVAPHLPAGAGTEWDVFSPDGSPAGTVRTDLAVELDSPVPIVRGDMLYGVVRDELDVPSVVRFRIPPLR